MWTFNNIGQNDQNERPSNSGETDTSRLKYVFLQIYPYDPTSKFQELEIGSNFTFMRSKIKSVRQMFSLRKYEMKNSLQSVSQIFIKFGL